MNRFRFVMVSVVLASVVALHAQGELTGKWQGETPSGRQSSAAMPGSPRSRRTAHGSTKSPRRFTWTAGGRGRYSGPLRTTPNVWRRCFR